MVNFSIIRDTREKEGWTFEFDTNILVEDRCLKFGDYSIVGLEDSIRIERKRNTGEIAINFGKKNKNFIKEMESLSQLDRAFVICEFTMDKLLSFPINSGIPKKFWNKLRINGKFLAKRIIDFEIEYNVKFLFYDGAAAAENAAFNILKEYYEDTQKSI